MYLTQQKNGIARSLPISQFSECHRVQLITIRQQLNKHQKHAAVSSLLVEYALSNVGEVLLWQSFGRGHI